MTWYRDETSLLCPSDVNGLHHVLCISGLHEEGLCGSQRRSLCSVAANELDFRFHPSLTPFHFGGLRSAGDVAVCRTRLPVINFQLLRQPHLVGQRGEASARHFFVEQCSQQAAVDDASVSTECCPDVSEMHRRGQPIRGIVEHQRGYADFVVGYQCIAYETVRERIRLSRKEQPALDDPRCVAQANGQRMIDQMIVNFRSVGGVRPIEDSGLGDGETIVVALYVAAPRCGSHAERAARGEAAVWRSVDW